ncbi:MAG: hypothetical protein U9Q83_00600 [Bacteroidota bacterium]|nr:hypothetical protein [Bacteroidota bacterium]
MKKNILVLVFVLGIFNFGNAQKIQWQQISLGCGSSLTGVFTNIVATSNLINSAYSTPVINLSYTYLFESNIGVGAIVAYQYIYADLLPFESQTSGVSFSLNRISASMHAEYYIVQRNSFDFYLGGKLGFNAWSSKIQFDLVKDYVTEIIPYEYVTDLIFKKVPIGKTFRVAKFTYQLTLGADYFFSDNFGIKGELAFGAPYWTNFGLNFRF